MLSLLPHLDNYWYPSTYSRSIRMHLDEGRLYVTEFKEG